MPTPLYRLNRRGAIAAGLGGLASLSRPAFSAVERPAEFDVIDCHTHFYDPTRPEGIPWPSKGSPIYRTVLPQHLRALKHYRRVTGTVIVEASPRLEDNAWLLNLAKDDPFVVGVVGNLEPGSADFSRHLRRFAADPLFRGIRVSSELVKNAAESESTW